MKDTKNGREIQDPRIHIEALEPDPTRRGYTQIPNYFKYYWTPLIGHKAASVYEMILSFSHGDKDACHPSLNRLCAHLKMDHRELIGRWRKVKQSGETKEYRERGMLEVLQEYELLFIETYGGSPYTRSYTFKVLKNPPLLTTEHLSGLPKLLRESHRRLVERCEVDRVKISRLLLEDPKSLEESQDPQIRIEGLELDPVRRGYAQIPNYFKYYWTPLIGHKAASVYEMILSFAHGDKDTCNPSLNRLCAHLDMDYRELSGREHHFRNANGKAQKYQKRGVLKVLQDHGLLFIEIRSEGPYTRSYTFKVLKNPPFLTPEQLSCLPKLLQEVHQRLVEKCEDDRAKLGHFQAFREGGG